MPCLLPSTHACANLIHYIDSSPFGRQRSLTIIPACRLTSYRISSLIGVTSAAHAIGRLPTTLTNLCTASSKRPHNGCTSVRIACSTTSLSKSPRTNCFRLRYALREYILTEGVRNHTRQRFCPGCTRPMQLRPTVLSLSPSASTA